MNDMDGFLGKVVVDSANGGREVQRHTDALKLMGQRQINITQQDQITDQRAYIRELEQTILELKTKNSSLENSASITSRPLDMAKNLEDAIRIGKDAYKTSGQIREEESQKYESLLAQPMGIIAEKNADFKKTYEEQQTILADWMVSQKAFKELAIEFGFDKGYTPEQVKAMGLDKEVDVLEDKNDPSHGTNVGDSTIIGPRREALLDKAQKGKAARKAKKSS